MAQRSQFVYMRRIARFRLSTAFSRKCKCVSANELLVYCSDQTLSVGVYRLLYSLYSHFGRYRCYNAFSVGENNPHSHGDTRAPPNTWFLGSAQIHAPKRHLDWFIRFSTAHTHRQTEGQTDRQAYRHTDHGTSLIFALCTRDAA